MAVGGPTSWLFEVEWDGVSFTDETAYLKAGGEVTVTRGRSSEADDAQPGVLSGVLDNAGGTVGVAQTGRFTAGNPLSSLYPNVKDGVRTRFTVTRGGVSSVRHRGRLAVGTPQVPGDGPARAEVAVSSTDVLGQWAQQTLACDFVERWKASSRSFTCDVFPFDETANTPATFRNVGSGAGTASLIRPLTGVGAVAMATPEGVMLDSSVELTAASAVGPIISLTTSIAAGSVTDIVIPFRTADRTLNGGADKWIASGLDAGGNVLWSLRLKDNAGQCDLNLYDSSGAFVDTLLYAFSAVGAASGNDQWFSLRMVYSGGVPEVFLHRATDATIVYGNATGMPDARNTAQVVLGGQANRRLKGKQTNCTSVKFGAVGISANVPGHQDFLAPNYTTTAQTRIADLAFYMNSSSSLSGSRNRAVARKLLTGRTAFDAVVEVARTCGAVVVADLSAAGTVKFIDSDQQRLATVAITVDAEGDADGSAGLPMRIGGVPSVVTATYPGGQVTYTDSSRQRIDGQVETCAADDTLALDPAAALANSSRLPRLEQLVVDIAGASNDLWSSMMGLELGARIRVNLGTAGTPLVTMYGRTYFDVYAVGWSEHYGEGVAYWVIDTVPADDPVDGAFDDTDRGRFSATAGTMTVTSGTAVGTTSTGTIVVTTTGGAPTWSTAAGDYPLTADWNGELVTITSAPAGSASPQTLTITARGVAPSVARSHSAGEPIDVAYPASFTW